MYVTNNYIAWKALIKKNTHNIPRGANSFNFNLSAGCQNVFNKNSLFGLLLHSAFIKEGGGGQEPNYTEN